MPEAEYLSGTEPGTGLDDDQPVVIQIITALQGFPDTGEHEDAGCGDIRIRKEWDPLYLKLLKSQYGEDRDPPDCQITATIAGQRITETVGSRDGFEWIIEGAAPENPEDMLDPALYSVRETGTPFTGLSSPGGTTFIPVYSGPDLSIEDGKAIYTFTVTNMLQFEYTSVDVTKSWDDELGSRDTFNWPDYVTVKWLRNV